MNSQVITSHLVAIACVLFLAIPFLAVFAEAYDNNFYPAPSSADMWTLTDQQNDTFGAWEHLLTNGYIDKSIDYSSFEYIFVLTQQLCTMTKNVDPEVALAMIAVESNFDTTKKTGSARGLMQIIPLYHSKRMERFVEKDHQIDLEDFYDPRLNIATGLDYLDEIISQTKGDISYALMWYNQGPSSASKDYVDYRKISSYARKVESLAEELKPFIGKEYY